MVQNGKQNWYFVENFFCPLAIPPPKKMQERPHAQPPMHRPKFLPPIKVFASRPRVEGGMRVGFFTQNLKVPKHQPWGKREGEWTKKSEKARFCSLRQQYLVWGGMTAPKTSLTPL